MAIIVNGERIEEGQVEAEVERLSPHYRVHVEAEDTTGEAGPDQLHQWAVENLIERALVLQAAREMPWEIPQSEIDAAYEQVKDRSGDAPPQEVKAEVEMRLRVDRFLAEGVPETPEPTDREVRQYYDENRDDFTTPEQVRASHIVKHVHGEADKMRAYQEIVEVQLALAGGASFEDLAARHSDCPERAGDLGVFARGQMVQEFEDVVFALNVGEVSDVFETPYGYHIAKLYERRARRTAPFEQVKEGIARELLDRRRQEALDAFVDSLKAGATIEHVDERGGPGQADKAAEPVESDEPAKS